MNNLYHKFSTEFRLDGRNIRVYVVSVCISSLVCAVQQKSGVS